MSIVVFDGLDTRTSSDIVKSYCQNYGRVINCYIKSNQCLVTFADRKDAEELIRTSPHRIGSNGLVCANWKAVAASHSTAEKRPLNHPTDQCRVTVRGTSEQLEEKTLLHYFSRFGHIRMCVSNCSQGFATITFDDRIGYGRALNESKHFLNGRSLIVERYDPESHKRLKPASNEQKHLENQYQQRVQAHDLEKKQWNDYLLRQQSEFQQQLAHYQQLLQQSLVEITLKNQQIEQLKQENKDIDDLLRQSVHDNEQQQVQSRKREDVHNQTKRKYEDLYRAYMKLKDNCSISTEKDSLALLNKPKSTIDNVKKKL